MVEYSCKKCGKKFDRKFLYDQHRNRKTDCRNDSKENGSELVEHRCKKCEKKFSRKDSLTRHMKTCKVKSIKNGGNNNNNVIGNDNIVGNTNSHITINNNNNNNRVKIVLLNYPPDKFSFFGDLKKILTSNKNLIMEIFRHTNINKDHPEHHNIYYPDNKKSIGEMYTNNRWNAKKIDDIINSIIENNVRYLKEYLKDLGVVLTDDVVEKINTACQDFYDSNARKILGEHIKILLYDNRHMIKKTKQLAKND
jgi:Zinc finger, C2H2 type.